jgi:hypothetical protein
MVQLAVTILCQARTCKPSLTSHCSPTASSVLAEGACTLVLLLLSSSVLVDYTEFAAADAITYAAEQR